MSSPAREAFAKQVAKRRPAWVPLTSEPLSSIRAEKLQSTGFSSLGKALSAEQCDTLRRYFSSKKVEDPYRPQHGWFLPQSTDKPAASHVAYHAAADVLRAPGLLALANDPILLDTVAQFLGCKPTIAYMASWWSYPTEMGAQQAEYFHRDVDDWRFVKLFVYLTDVGPRNGPHIYVTQSSRSDRLRRIGRFSNEEVEEAFGVQNVKTVTGEAGDAFLEDTFGVHKGQPVVEGHRLIFQVVYSIFEQPYGPKRPIAHDAQNISVNVAGLDPFVNRVYVNAQTVAPDKQAVNQL